MMPLFVIYVFKKPKYSAIRLIKKKFIYLLRIKNKFKFVSCLELNNVITYKISYIKVNVIERSRIIYLLYIFIHEPVKTTSNDRDNCQYYIMI
jgi:hypothetical protein